MRRPLSGFARGKFDAAAFVPDRRKEDHGHKDDCDDDRERLRIIRDAAERRVFRCQEVSNEAMGEASKLPSWYVNPGNVPRTLPGESSFRCTGMMPHAPCTKNCMIKAPTVSSETLGANWS